jgi:3-oxoacyl-[acyl-carrier-protein] synthase II
MTATTTTFATPGPVRSHGPAQLALAVTGIGVVAPPRPGLDAFASALAKRPAAMTAVADPERSPHVLEEFDVRAHLGRRGTSTLDRVTSLALVACAEALADRQFDVDRRVGVSLGTTTGSLRSMSEYTRETLVEERPYLVNPALFPNTVMNCSAGQAAIRHGLRGINATIAGGDVAFFGVLRQALRALRLGHIDATLGGAAEEFSPQRAWQMRLARRGGPGPVAGEGAAMFLLERAADAAADGRRPLALIESVTSGYCPGGESPALAPALGGCIARALRDAGAGPDAITAVACRVPTETILPGAGHEAAAAALGRPPRRWLDLDAVLGDCGAATSALQLAALIVQSAQRPTAAVERALLIGWTRDGALAAAVVRTGDGSPGPGPHA